MYLNDIWGDILAIPNTINTHWVGAVSPFIVKHAIHSKSNVYTTTCLKSNYTLGNDVDTASTSNTNETPCFDSTKEPNIGDFIIARVMGKVSPKNFVAQITEKSEMFYEVHFLKQGISKSFIINEEDTHTVDTADVMGILPTPSLSNRGHYIFDCDLTILSK